MLDIPARASTIWKCIFCQEQNNEKLIHSYRKKHFHSSYDSIETDIDEFIKNNVPLPFRMTKECLVVDMKTVAKSLLENEAVFHKSCRDLINLLFSSYSFVGQKVG